jgi:hypothetical protein
MALSPFHHITHPEECGEMARGPNGQGAAKEKEQEEVATLFLSFSPLEGRVISSPGSLKTGHWLPSPGDTWWL